MVGVPGKLWATSSLLSNSVKHVFRAGYDCLVTYSDRQAGHDGNTYLAANWKRLDSDAQPDGFIWRIDGRIVSRKSFYARFGTSAIATVKEFYGDRLRLEPDVPKRRFVILKDSSRWNDLFMASEKKKTWGAARTKSFEASL